MSDCKHEWEWVADDGDGMGDFWICHACGRLIWGDDPAYAPAVTTGSSNRVTYIPFVPGWGTDDLA